jgi:nitrite reductase/ring-hydroxylating ferredoxin subunit
MAATSHDFWLKNLSPKIWKTLHMLVYVAYALIVMHVVLGVLQQETSPVLVGLMVLGMLMIIGFHLWAGVLEGRREAVFSAKESFIKICRVEEIDENCAKVVIVQEENIAIFKYEGKVSAINNVCKHQNGPLGEGKMVDGCITCPWHGYQYLPENGCSPAPFTEKVTTYDVKVEDGYVFVNPNPHPEGTAVEPATI